KCSCAARTARRPSRQPTPARLGRTTRAHRSGKRLLRRAWTSLTRNWTGCRRMGPRSMIITSTGPRSVRYEAAVCRYVLLDCVTESARRLVPTGRGVQPDLGDTLVRDHRVGAGRVSRVL